MSNEKMVKLIEALAAAGYEIIKINSGSQSQSKFYVNIEITVSFSPQKDIPSEEKIIELIKIFSSVSYSILKLEIPFDYTYGVFNNIILELN